MTPEEQVYLDMAVQTVCDLDARIASLESDVINYREMIAVLLERLASQNAQVERLMWRVRHGR